MKSVISVEKMVELYLQYELDERTWDMLYEMSLHGLISVDAWHRFYAICAYWHLDSNGENCIGQYDEIVATRDADRNLVRVK